MAGSVDEYYKKIYKSGEQSLIDSENVLNENALKSKDIINQQADASVQTVTDSYNTKIADVKEGYNEAFNRNEVQKVLNERYLERKAAEMGLTDSGMNRTQMTANQLSHANQQGRLDAALQKDVNTLAAAMQAQISGINTQRNADIAEVDMNLNSGISKLRSDFETSVREQAVKAHNAEYEAEQEAITAAKKARSDAYAKLVDSMIKSDLDEEQKLNAFSAYSNMYGFDSPEQAQATLKYAGIDATVDNEGNVTLSEEYSPSSKTRSYTIRKTKNTFNWGGLFGGIDTDDTYEIVDDATGNVVKTISNMDDFSSLTNAQKKQLSNLKLNGELSTDVFKFSEDGLRRFIKSIS